MLYQRYVRFERIRYRHVRRRRLFLSVRNFSPGMMKTKEIYPGVEAKILIISASEIMLQQNQGGYSWSLYYERLTGFQQWKVCNRPRRAFVEGLGIALLP